MADDMQDLMDGAGKAIYERALPLLDKEYELTWIEYDDQFSDEQIHKILDGNASDVEMEIDELWMDAKYDAAVNVMKELLAEPDYEVLKESGWFDELRFSIEERDSVNPMETLARRTRDRLWRYNLDVEVLDPYCFDEEELAANRREIMEATGLTDDAAIQRWLSETGGGMLSVLWYGDAEDVLVPAMKAQWQDKKYTATWTKPRLLVLNAWSGSGMDFETPDGFTITRDLDLEKLRLDARKGHGYSWTEVCDPVPSCYECKFTFEEKPEQ